MHMYTNILIHTRKRVSCIHRICLKGFVIYAVAAPANLGRAFCSAPANLDIHVYIMECVLVYMHSLFRCIYGC
jgi:hypothetical protein